MKRKFLISLLVFAGILLATPVVYSQQTEDDESGEVQSTQSKYGQDSATCVMKLSLYREFYKQWKKNGYKGPTINDAIAPWRWAFLNCPRSTKNIYIDGANILEYMINNAESDEKRDKLIDTLMMMYDQRIKYFDQEGYVLERKGYDLYRLRTKDYEDAYNIFKKSVELRGNKTSAPILIYYFRTTIKMATTGKIDSVLIVEAYDKVSNILEYNIEKLKNKGKSTEALENVQNNIDGTFEPFATCDDLIAIYSTKFKENPEDIELLKKITDKLDEHKCNETELFFNTSIKLYDLEPSPESALFIGKMYINKKNYSKALEYLNEATAIEDTASIADVYYYMAFCHQQLKNKQSARSNALKSLKHEPDNGDAYILIGDLYASSSEECAENELAKRSVYWAAVDKYYKAKSVDPDVKDIASERIRAYSQYFPNTETIFFHNYEKGDKYTVGCWINETTTIRSSD